MRIPAAIKEYLPGGAGQLASLGHVARFFGVLLVLTLAARGTAGAAMPKVTTAAPHAAALTETVDAAGTVAVQAGKPLQLPAGLLVTEVCVEAGAQVAAGAPLARVDTEQLALAIRQAEAELAQLRVSYAQGMEPAKADDYAVRQSQERLTEAYADSEEIWDEGEASVRRAQEDLNAAREALDAARADPAVPTAAAEAGLAAAEAALEQARKNAEAANEAAHDRALSVERERNSAIHSYEQALEAAQKAAAANQAAAGVTVVSMAAKEAELARLRALEKSGGAVLAPYSGTVTALDLAPGAATPAVGGLLAGLDTDAVLTFTLPKAQAGWVKAGMPVTVRQGQRTLDTTVRSAGVPDADGSVQVSVTLPADGGWQAGGASARLTARLGEYPLCLPAAAVRSDGGGSFVYKVEPKDTVLGRQNVLVRIPVTVEQSGGGMAAVSGALASADAVVTGADRPLAAGACVRPDGEQADGM